MKIWFRLLKGYPVAFKAALEIFHMFSSILSYCPLNNCQKNNLWSVAGKKQKGKQYSCLCRFLYRYEIFICGSLRSSLKSITNTLLWAVSWVWQIQMGVWWKCIGCSIALQSQWLRPFQNMQLLWQTNSSFRSLANLGVTKSKNQL